MQITRREADVGRQMVVALRLLGEEMFVVIRIDFDARRLTHVADPMTETALRAHLARGGTSPDDVGSLITQARASRGESVLRADEECQDPEKDERPRDGDRNRQIHGSAGAPRGRASARHGRRVGTFLRNSLVVGNGVAEAHVRPYASARRSGTAPRFQRRHAHQRAIGTSRQAPDTRGMFLDPERPLLLIDDGQEMFLAVNRALDRLGAWRPVMLIPQYDAAVHYIADSVRAGRPPAAIVIRTPDSDDARLALLEWVRHQPEPTRSIQILVMTDEAIDGCADGLDACLEETLGQMFRHGDATRV